MNKDYNYNWLMARLHCVFYDPGSLGDIAIEYEIRRVLSIMQKCGSYNPPSFISSDTTAYSVVFIGKGKTFLGDV